MARTIAQLEAQIAKLQRQAEKLRKREVAGVIARINVAIQYYKLRPEDLDFKVGGTGSIATKRKGQNGPKTARNRKKTVGPIRFRDERGNAWTGRGRAPGWFNHALASGKTREDLAVSA